MMTGHLVRSGSGSFARWATRAASLRSGCRGRWAGLTPAPLAARSPVRHMRAVACGGPAAGST